jgi:hypothetical protein
MVTSRSMKSALIVCALVAMSFAGCSAGPKVADYPKRVIDRPYTLPNGLDQWSTRLDYIRRDLRGVRDEYFFEGPMPLYWRTSLSDTWNLEWALLPLAASHQLNHSRSMTSGITFGLQGIGYSSSAGLLFDPMFAHYTRPRLNDDFALETLLQGAYFLETRGGYFRRIPWNLRAELGLLWQTSDRLSSGIRAGVVHRKESQQIEDPALLSPTIEVSEIVTKFPLTIRSTYVFGPQWELSGSYQYVSDFEGTGYIDHTGTVSLDHRW